MAAISADTLASSVVELLDVVKLLGVVELLGVVTGDL